MQPGWCQPVRQEFTENECEALPGVAYPGVRDNCSTLNTKTGYDGDDDVMRTGFYNKLLTDFSPPEAEQQHNSKTRLHFRISFTSRGARLRLYPYHVIPMQSAAFPVIHITLQLSIDINGMNLK